MTAKGRSTLMSRSVTRRKMFLSSLHLQVCLYGSPSLRNSVRSTSRFHQPQPLRHLVRRLSWRTSPNSLAKVLLHLLTLVPKIPPNVTLQRAPRLLPLRTSLPLYQSLPYHFPPFRLRRGNSCRQPYPQLLVRDRHPFRVKACAQVSDQRAKARERRDSLGS